MEGQKNIRQALLEQSAKSAEELNSIFENNSENITRFFEQFVGDGIKVGTKFEVSAEGVGLLHDAIQSLSKMKEDYQISSIVCDIQSKELQKMLYIIASDFTQADVKLDV